MKGMTCDLDVALIDEPPLAMRSEIDRDEVFELAKDIRRNGLINPITVRPKGNRYEVVAGHRRLLAHRYGAIAKIKCVVRDLNDDDAFAIMTSENLARVNVNPVDEATHVSRLLEIHKGDIDKVIQIVGRSEGWVESRLAIGEMDEDYKLALKHGKIPLGVALALSQITNDVDRRAVLDMAISQGATNMVAQYWLAQWRAGLFGHALEKNLPDPDMPGNFRKTVMLRCAIDGKEYPATEFQTFLVHSSNVGFMTALGEHVRTEAGKTDAAPAAQ